MGGCDEDRSREHRVFAGRGEDRGVIGEDCQGAALALSRVGDRNGHAAGGDGDGVKCVTLA